MSALTPPFRTFTRSLRFHSDYLDHFYGHRDKLFSIATSRVHHVEITVSGSSKSAAWHLGSAGHAVSRWRDRPGPASNPGQWLDRARRAWPGRLRHHRRGVAAGHR